MLGRGEFRTTSEERREYHKVKDAASAMSYVAAFTGLPASVWHVIVTEDSGYSAVGINESYA